MRFDARRHRHRRAARRRSLWSSDSKRVACLSSDLTEQRGNLFSTPRPAPLKKQTAVYQLSGEIFARVELPLGEVPGRESDTELERAILGHEYTEPIRWQKPNVLVLERHEYYRKIKPTSDRQRKVRIDTRLRSALSDHRHHRPGWKGDTCLEAPQRPTVIAQEDHQQSHSALDTHLTWRVYPQQC